MKKPPPDQSTWIIIGVCVLVAVAVIAYILLKPKDEEEIPVIPSVLTKTPPQAPPPPSLPPLAPVSPPPPSPVSPPGLDLTGSPAPAPLGLPPVFGSPAPSPVFSSPTPSPARPPGGTPAPSPVSGSPSPSPIFGSPEPAAPSIVSNLLSQEGFFLRIGSNFATVNSDNRMVLGSTGNRFRYRRANEAGAGDDWGSGDWVVEVLGITPSSPRRFLRHMNEEIWAHTVAQIRVGTDGVKEDFWWDPPLAENTNADMVVIRQGDHSIGIDDDNFLILALNRLVSWSTDSTVPPVPLGVCPGGDLLRVDGTYVVNINPAGLSGHYMEATDSWTIWNNWAACGSDMKIQLENDDDFNLNEFTDAVGNDGRIYKLFPNMATPSDDPGDNGHVYFGRSF